MNRRNFIELAATVIPCFQWSPVKVFGLYAEEASVTFWTREDSFDVECSGDGDHTEVLQRLMDRAAAEKKNFRLVGQIVHLRSGPLRIPDGLECEICTNIFTHHGLRNIPWGALATAPGFRTRFNA